jgi:hypothetical protein
MGVLLGVAKIERAVALSVQRLLGILEFDRWRFIGAVPCGVYTPKVVGLFTTP